MTTTIRRLAATLALPTALLLTATACGDDEPSTDATSADASSQSATEPDDGGAASGEESQAAGGEVPDAGDIPDPSKDPEGFKAYVEKMYVDSGMSEKQASCMADAFTDNVDVEKMTDPSAISGMMGNQKLQDAMMDCM